MFHDNLVIKVSENCVSWFGWDSVSSCQNFVTICSFELILCGFPRIVRIVLCVKVNDSSIADAML